MYEASSKSLTGSSRSNQIRKSSQSIRHFQISSLLSTKNINNVLQLRGQSKARAQVVVVVVLILITNSHGLRDRTMARLSKTFVSLSGNTRMSKDNVLEHRGAVVKAVQRHSRAEYYHEMHCNKSLGLSEDFGREEMTSNKLATTLVIERGEDQLLPSQAREGTFSRTTPSSIAYHSQEGTSRAKSEIRNENLLIIHHDLWQRSETLSTIDSDSLFGRVVHVMRRRGCWWCISSRLQG